MLSDPETIRVLYNAPEHTLPPGRTLALRPIMGPRSVLLLEGREHLARRRLMLPPFHGQRMRAYESIVRRRRGERGRALARRRALRDPPADAARHARGHPARRLRRHGPGPPGATGRAPGTAADGHRFRRPAIRRPAIAPPRCTGPAQGAGGAATCDRRDARRRDLRAPVRPSRRHPLHAHRRALRGRRADGRRRDPRSTDHAATRRPRDDRHRARVDVRSPASPPRGPRAPARRDRCRLGRRVHARRRGGVASPATGGPARRTAAGLGAEGRSLTSCRPAPTSRRRSGLRTRAPTPTPSRSPSAPSGSSRARRRRTRGSRSAEASGAASEPRSPRWRCASRSRRSCAGAC